MKWLTQIIDFLFGKVEIVQDNFWGKMIEVDDYYECKKYFQPTGKEVEIELAKTSSDLVEKQRDFFCWIEKNYNSIIENISPSLEKQVAEWMIGYKIQNFSTEYDLEYLEIPKCGGEVCQWQISFWARNELQHWCTISMKGLEVENVLIDG